MFDIALNEEDIMSVTFYGRKIHCLSSQNLKQMMITHLLQSYNIRMNSTNKYFH